MAISWRDVAIWMTAVITAVAAQGLGSVRASPTLESYASIDQACREWTNGCAVCRRQGDGSIGCSLPGIACQPVAITCQAPVASGAASRAVPGAP